MSHYSEMKTKIKRKGALIKALQQINNGKWKNCVEVHEIPTNLYGYQNDIRKQKADIIIRRKNVGQSSNDIGFALTKDGTYQAIISQFDSSAYSDKFLDKLNQLYAFNVVKEVADQNGFTIEETSEENGEIYVTCGRN